MGLKKKIQMKMKRGVINDMGLVGLKPTLTTSPLPPPPSGTSYSSSSPFVEARQWKREREEDDGDGELCGPVTKLCTAFGDFT